MASAPTPPPATAEPCRIGGTAMAQVFTAGLLGRHAMRFYACPACQHLAVAGADVLSPAGG